MPTTSDLPSSHTALVAIGPHAGTDPHAPRPAPRNAPFLTHLIATARQLPQVRARRRAEPADAIAAYREAIRKLNA
jgi:hypothetical protein